ncbi:acylglycerol kinase family protein [Flavonifractor plautii]|nr:acylglycerol kinase family protein [Flavonifractor plautii]
MAAARAGEFDRIVCSGGDGTLHEVVAGLMGLENRPEVGYIPAGTTNDFAKNLSLPRGWRPWPGWPPPVCPGRWTSAPSTTAISSMWPPSGPLPTWLTARPSR